MDLKSDWRNICPQSSLKKHTHKNFWIKKLLALGLQPEIEPGVDLSLSRRLGRGRTDLDSETRSLFGHPKLTNSTDGGEGVEGLVFSEESRKKMPIR